MGSIFGKAMDENLKKQQQFMLETQTLQLERQIQMQNQMREKMMAIQMGRARDMFLWFSSFYTVTAVFCLIGARRKRASMIPLLPLTFILAYQYDLAYGNKMKRIRAEADRILDDEALMLELPHGIPTFASIEAGRLDQKDKERLTKSNDLFL